MNSKQRRTDKRLWKYSVKVPYQDYDNYVKMWDWLKLKYGTKARKCGWRDRHGPFISDDIKYFLSYDIEWQFSDERKYIEFTLRWL